MPTKADKKLPQESAGAPASAAAAPSFAIIMELDSLAIQGRSLRFAALKSLLSAEGVALDVPLFSRYCLHSSPEHSLDHLAAGLKKEKLNAAKLVERYKEKIAEAYLSSGTTLAPGLSKLLDAALERGFALGAISIQTQETADKIAENVGLLARGVKVIAFGEVGKDFPKADAWLKMAKALSRTPRRCMALTSSMSSCKSALSADLYCIAVPDEFTSCQDFSGANRVAESLSDVNVKELLETFCRTSR